MSEIEVLLTFPLGCWCYWHTDTADMPDLRGQVVAHHSVLDIRGAPTGVVLIVVRYPSNPHDHYRSPRNFVACDPPNPLPTSPRSVTIARAAEEANGGRYVRA